MTGAAGVRAIVAGHGDFAAGVVSAVDQVTGLGSLFLPFSNAGLGREALEEALGRALEGSGVRVVFTDLPAGSCTMVLRRLLRARPGVALVTGANVPLLVDFAMQPDDADPVAAATESLRRGAAAMAIHAA